MDEQRKNPYRRAPRQPEVDRKPARSSPNAEARQDGPPRGQTDPERKPDRRNEVAAQGSGDRRGGLRQLPPDLRDLADGKVDRLRRPYPAKPPLDDEREGAVIPGVRNSEARAAYDARVATLRAALAAGQTAELAAGLQEVRQLALWRARNVTDYRAFAESVVGVPAGSAATLAGEAEDAQVLPPEAIALQIRIEAALAQRPPGGRVRMRRTEGGLKLELSMSVDDVPRAVENLSDVGRAVTALRRFLRPDALEAPSTQPHFDRPREPNREPNRGPNRGPNRDSERDPSRRRNDRPDRQAGAPRPARFPGRDDHRKRPPKRRDP